MGRSRGRSVMVLLPVLMLLVLALPAQAVMRWCKTDPVVTLNGTPVDIQVDVPLEYVALVNGPVRVEVLTPKPVARQLILSGPGFNLHGEQVVFLNRTGTVVDKRFPTTVRVRVPIDKTRLRAGEVVPVQVTVLPSNAPLPVIVQGTSDLTKVELTVRGF